jgi:hypothetical protein
MDICLKEKRMTRNLIALGCAGLLAFGLSLSAFAGSVTDSDGDGVPDGFDNCVDDPNGPSGSTAQCDSQEDYDQDGYGQICDEDVDNNGNTLGGDLSIVLAAIGNVGNDATDIDCSGSTLGGDLSRVLAAIGTQPGPSGLACAGTVPCP